MRGDLADAKKARDAYDLWTGGRNNSFTIGQHFAKTDC